MISIEKNADVVKEEQQENKTIKVIDIMEKERKLL